MRQRAGARDGPGSGRGFQVESASISRPQPKDGTRVPRLCARPDCTWSRSHGSFGTGSARVCGRSPPCQRFSQLATREDLSGYPDLIEPIRAKLIAAGVPYVIENVPGAPIRKDLMLCGAMFGLRCYRHRHFECSFPVAQPPHPKHMARVNRRGENRREHWANGGFMTITGDVGTYCGPEAMGIDWMTGAEMSEAIPPAYAEYISREAIARVRSLANPRGSSPPHDPAPFLA
jgi:DNA (cytosine-5)-methyltransferase 1